MNIIYQGKAIELPEGANGVGAAKELEKGRLLVLQVYYHKIYGTHLVVAYGLEHYQALDGRIRTYIKLADGWSSRPRYLALEDVKVCGYFSLEKKG